MANLRTLGIATAMVLGAVGVSSCIWDCSSMGCDGNHSGHKTENKSSTTNPQPQRKQEPKEKVAVMPPLTTFESGDTLIFKSKQDSTDYAKYNQIAYDNYNKTSIRYYERMDSLLNATRQEADSISEAERKEWEPKLLEIKNRYNKDLEKLEQQYKDGKITFEKLEAEKKALETKTGNETGKLLSKYQKGNYAQNAYFSLNYLEQRRHEQVASEAYAQYQKDRDEMRKKYCKEVRPYASKTSTSKQNNVKGMTIDGVKVKWKSPQDSIAVSNYINAQREKEEKANAKFREQQEKLEEQISQIVAQQEQLEYESNVLYKQGKTQAAINKEQQSAKLDDKIANLEEKIFDLEEKCKYEEISIDTINKHAVQNFDEKKIKKMHWNF